MDDQASAALLQAAIATLDVVETANDSTPALLPPALVCLPRRRPHTQRAHAQRIATVLFPALKPETALIRYEEQRRRAVAALRLRERTVAEARRLKEAEREQKGHTRPDRYREPWKGQLEDPVEMPRALPMPVAIGKEEDFLDCFAFLRAGGAAFNETDCVDGDININMNMNIDMNINIKPGYEPIHKVPFVEFPRGVIYADGRLDLCKMVVGPDHIDALMDALASAPHIRHFLLGNNVVTSHGARRIARFIAAHRAQVSTWYLAGNHIKPAGLRALAAALQDSPALTNLWLKRNPLGAGCVPDLLALLRAPTHRLRVLDVETCELGDAGVAALFDGLLDIPGNTLEAIYLNGNGVSTLAAASIARFLASASPSSSGPWSGSAPCKLTHLMLSSNPLGDDGARALAPGLAHNTTLEVLTLASCGLSSAGVAAICDALAGPANEQDDQGQRRRRRRLRLRSLDLSSRFTTADLGQRFNHIADEAVDSLTRLVFAGGRGQGDGDEDGNGDGKANGPLRFLKLGHVALSHDGLERLRDAVVDEQKSALVDFTAIRVGMEHEEDENSGDGDGDGDGVDSIDADQDESHTHTLHDSKADTDPAVVAFGGARHRPRPTQTPPSCSLRVHQALEKNYHRLYQRQQRQCQCQCQCQCPTDDDDGTTAANVPYARFISASGPSRLLRNHPDVRFIDSVYRNREKPNVAAAQGKVRKFWDLEMEAGDIALWKRLDAIE